MNDTPTPETDAETTYLFHNRDGKTIKLRGDLTMEEMIRDGWTDFKLVKPETPLGENVWRASDSQQTKQAASRRCQHPPVMPLQLLRNCPFCGLSDIDTISPDMGETPAVTMHSYPGGYRVECEGCGCNGPWHDDHQAALDAWDSRHNVKGHASPETAPEFDPTTSSALHEPPC